MHKSNNKFKLITFIGGIILHQIFPHILNSCYTFKLRDEVLLPFFIFQPFDLLILVLLCRNYVVQCTLDLKIASAATTLTLQFEGSYAHMSMQRYSSHVVEKCLEVFNDEQRAEIIHELLSDPHFDQLLQDPQANYVIQKALRCSEVCSHTSFSVS